MHEETQAVAGGQRLDRLTDAGLAHLAGLINLETLDLRRTKATESGVKNPAATLPKCKITSDYTPTLPPP